VRGPEVFLFDEPLSNLDAELRVEMRVEIARLHKEIGATMIYVTHDQVEAMTLADKIVVLRAGRIEQVGAPLDLYNDPDNRFVAGFIGSPAMNRTVITRAGPNELAQGGAHVGQFGHLAVDLLQVLLRHGLHIRRGAAVVLPQGKQCPAILDRETQRPGMGEKAELVNMRGGETPVAVGVTVGRDQADILVVANGLGR
jgi:ABC-type proline/glycine betaine transport system ATPase subunit